MITATVNGIRQRDITGSARPLRRRWAIFILIATLLAGSVLAIDDTVVEIEQVDGAGWHAQDIVARLDIHGATPAIQGNVARLWLDSPAQEVRDVRIECPRAALAGERIACDVATIVAVFPVIGRQSLHGRIVYTRRTGALEVALDGFVLAQGRAGVQLAMEDKGWRGTARLEEVRVDALLDVVRKWGVTLPKLTAAGMATVSLDARGRDAAIASARFDGRFTKLTANNDAGSLATDNLALELKGSVTRRPAGWDYQVEARSASGQAYAQPVFLDFGAHAMALSVQGSWRDAAKILTVQRFSLDHVLVAQATGQATLAFNEGQPLRSLSLDLKQLSFPGAYTSYLQPLLLETNFKALTTSGVVGGELQWEEGKPRSVDLRVDRLSIDDGARNFVVRGLTGEWHWHERVQSREDEDEDEEEERTARPAMPSTLRWEAATLLNLSIGAAELGFETSARQFRLLRPAHVPLLDGAIDLDSLRIRNVGLPSVAFIVDATIRPISAAQLCDAFGWPRFGGQIGGVISKLRMREGIITLGTTLDAQVFDGGVTISDLRLEQPFGQWPKFSSSIALKNLDLELVTGAFSFGRITGRLSGEIEGLQLFNWTPVAFDARLYTPADDRSRHRISQRAVENIGSIGGGGAGVTAALSSGFLRFFDDFNYERLGISCRLRNEVCAMDGVAPAPNGGYYLVKGRGVPRIDVIGSSHRVDWPRLVQQLIAATKSGGPVVN